MITPNSFFAPTDPETKRRQALANVYRFLLKLAEEKEKPADVPAPEEEKESEPEPLQENTPPAL